MDKRLIFLFGATFFWGIWGVAQKKAAMAMSPFLVMTVQNLLIFAVAAGVSVYLKPSPSGTGVWWSVVGGLASMLAMICFLFAVIDTRATVAQAVTAAYPVVTLVIAYFLMGETVTWIEGLGMGFVMAGVALLSLRI